MVEVAEQRSFPLASWRSVLESAEQALVETTVQGTKERRAGAGSSGKGSQRARVKGAEAEEAESHAPD